MTHYDLRHPLCNTEWQATYDEFPIEVQCIKCGEMIKTSYSPIITAVRPYWNGYPSTLHKNVR